MRSEAIAFLLSLGLATTPAWAGQAQDQNNSPGLGQSLGAAPSLSPNDDQSGAQDGLSGLQSEDALKQSLQKAGFTDLQIAAGSYVVHAKGPDGKPVVMMITPDAVAVANPQSAQLPGLDQNGDQSDSGSQDQVMPQLLQDD
jgi:hypothetical protein